MFVPWFRRSLDRVLVRSLCALRGLPFAGYSALMSATWSVIIGQGQRIAIPGPTRCCPVPSRPPRRGDVSCSSVGAERTPKHGSSQREGPVARFLAETMVSSASFGGHR
jgi:hypothetical protein